MWRAWKEDVKRRGKGLKKSGKKDQQQRNIKGSLAHKTEINGLQSKNIKKDL